MSGPLPSWSSLRGGREKRKMKLEGRVGRAETWMGQGRIVCVCGCLYWGITEGKTIGASFKISIDPEGAGKW